MLRANAGRKPDMGAAIGGDTGKVIAASFVATFMLSPVNAIAAPQQFDCSLTIVETKTAGKKDVGAEQRSIVLLVDKQARTVTVQQNDGARALDNVTMSEHNINGYVDDLSLSVDLSTWKIALQTYKSNPDWQTIEFGACTPNGKQ
jgi:hypothetical protein